MTPYRLGSRDVSACVVLPFVTVVRSGAESCSREEALTSTAEACC